MKNAATCEIAIAVLFSIVFSAQAFAVSSNPSAGATSYSEQVTANKKDIDWLKRFLYGGGFGIIGVLYLLVQKERKFHEKYDQMEARLTDAGQKGLTEIETKIRMIEEAIADVLDFRTAQASLFNQLKIENPSIRRSVQKEERELIEGYLDEFTKTQTALRSAGDDGNSDIEPLIICSTDYDRIGDAYHYIYNYPEAIDSYNAALVRKHNATGNERKILAHYEREVRIKLANSYAGTGCYSLAIEEYSRAQSCAAKVGAANAKIWHSMGDAYRGLMNYGKAIQLYDRTQEAITDHENALYLESLYQKANCLADLEEFDEAEEIYKKLIDAGEQHGRMPPGLLPWIKFSLNDLYRKSCAVKEAVKGFSALLEECRNDTTFTGSHEAKYLLAKTLLARSSEGDIDKAVELYRRGYYQEKRLWDYVDEGIKMSAMAFSGYLHSKQNRKEDHWDDPLIEKAIAGARQAIVDKESQEQVRCPDDVDVGKTRLQFQYAVCLGLGNSYRKQEGIEILQTLARENPGVCSWMRAAEYADFPEIHDSVRQIVGQTVVGAGA